MDDQKEMKTARIRIASGFFIFIAGCVVAPDNLLNSSLLFIVSALLMRPYFRDLVKDGPNVIPTDDQCVEKVNNFLLVIGMATIIIGAAFLIFDKNLLGLTAMVLGFIISWEELKALLNNSLDKV